MAVRTEPIPRKMAMKTLAIAYMSARSWPAIDVGIHGKGGNMGLWKEVRVVKTAFQGWEYD
jgi:hypothetical protein